MQLYAVGLEQMVWDLEIIGNGFAKNFKECEFKLRSVSLFLRLNSLSFYVIKLNNKYLICRSSQYI